jgi:hypothetical protein
MIFEQKNLIPPQYVSSLSFSSERVQAQKEEAAAKLAEKKRLAEEQKAQKKAAQEAKRAEKQAEKSRLAAAARNARGRGGRGRGGRGRGGRGRGGRGRGGRGAAFDARHEESPDENEAGGGESSDENEAGGGESSDENEAGEVLEAGGGERPDDNEFGEPFDPGSPPPQAPLPAAALFTPPAPGDFDSDGFRTPRGEPVRKKRSGTPLQSSPKKRQRTGLAFKVCVYLHVFLFAAKYFGIPKHVHALLEHFLGREPFFGLATGNLV